MTLKLSPHDAAKCQALLGEVRQRAERVAQVRDTASALATLDEVRRSILDAAEELQAARHRASQAAFEDLARRIAQ